MRRTAFFTCFVLLSTGRAHGGQAPQPGDSTPIKIEIVEMDPPSPASLHYGDHVYVHIRYDSRIPARIRVEPYFNGAIERHARLNGAPLLQPGQGDALLWFEFVSVAAVDSVHVLVSRDVRRGTIASQNVAVMYGWDGLVSAGETRAPWVGPLLAEDDRRQKAAFDQMEKSVNSMGSGGVGIVIAGLFGIVALGALVICMSWPIWGVVRWRGNWRIAAAVPLAATVLWGLKDAIDLVRDPTSHNLLPFEFIEAAVISAPYMLVVTILRAASLKKKKSS